MPACSSWDLALRNLILRLCSASLPFKPSSWAVPHVLISFLPRSGLLICKHPLVHKDSGPLQELAGAPVEEVVGGWASSWGAHPKPSFFSQGWAPGKRLVPRDDEEEMVPVHTVCTATRSFRSSPCMCGTVGEESCMERNEGSCSCCLPGPDEPQWSQKGTVRSCKHS